MSLTGGAEWNTKVNKELHAHYANNSIQIEAGDLDEICKLCAQNKMATYLGIMNDLKIEVVIVYIVL